MIKEIFFIAGEASGDALGASLMKALKSQTPEALKFTGIGGPLMQAEGLENLLLRDELAVMGLWEILIRLPRLYKLINQTVAEIEKRNPAAVVTIDFPDFNFEIGRRLKKNGVSKAKLIHYGAPTVWAWRPKRAEKIAKFLDGIMCLFPFEPPYFTKHGLKAEFVGHPVAENFREGDGAKFRKTYGIEPGVKTLGLLFGSRQSEFSQLSEILKDTAMLVRERHPDLHLIMPTLPELEYDLRKIVEDFDFSFSVVTKPELKWDAFAACDAALAVSGTIGLELAYAGAPHVIAYRMHPVTWLAMRSMVSVKYAHLANILLDELIVPEFLQGRATPINIGKEILQIYEMQGKVKSQKEKLLKIRDMLKPASGQAPSAKAAEFTFALINQ